MDLDRGTLKNWIAFIYMSCIFFWKGRHNLYQVSAVFSDNHMLPSPLDLSDAVKAICLIRKHTLLQNKQIF